MTQPRYDPTITLGNLLTIFSLIVGAIAFWGGFAARIAVIEERVASIPEIRAKVAQIETRTTTMWARSGMQSKQED